MNKLAILSIAFVASITLSVPNVYAEEDGFFDWLMNLFGGFEEKQSNEIQTLDETTSKIRKAVIIDQLHSDYPNESFQENATKILIEGGYEVDLVTTDDITIDFYKELPSMDYEFIVIRSHSLAIYGEKSSSWIFTGEKYQKGRYTQEQLFGMLSPGVPYRQGQITQMTQADAKGERLFMIGSKMIDEMMVGKFPGSVIILGGCDTMVYPYLAEALVKRGASSVVGWNGLVELRDNDTVMLSLLNEIFYGDKNIDDAVEKVVQDYDGKTYYGTKLKYFSSGASGPI